MNIVALLLLLIHVICCIGVILVVLLQAGKGASLGASFGGGSSQTVFGASSATFIGRITWVMAGAFMVTSLLLAMISPWGDGGALTGTAVLQEEPITAPPLGTAPDSGPPIGEDVSATVGGELTPSAPPATAPLDSPAESESGLPEPSAPQPSGQP